MYRNSTIVYFRILLFLPLMVSHSVKAQMVVGQDTLYGPEWIKYDQEYYKFYCTKDGLFQLNYEDLAAAGIPVQSISGAQWQIWSLGKEVTIKVNNTGSWRPGDYLQFWGSKNRSALDAFLFNNPGKEMLNPEYSLYTDSMTYFLTWTPAGSINKRITIKDSDPNLPVQTYFMVDQLTEHHVAPFDQKHDPENVISYSSYEACEGFGTKESRLYQQTFKASSPFNGNVPGRLSIRLAGNQRQHILRISINNQVQKVDTFFSYAMREYQLEIANDLLQNDILLKIEGTASELDNFVVSTIHFYYPKQPANLPVGDESIRIPSSPALIPVQNSGQGKLLMGAGMQQWITPILLNNQMVLELPLNLGLKATFQDTNLITRIVQLKKVMLEPLLSDVKSNYIIISHDKLIHSVDAYVQYRQSAAGGGFVVRVVNIEQIYNQFGYGIPRHIQSLKNFGQFINRRWPAVKTIFLIGRSLNYRDMRVDNNVVQYAHLHLIPTMGYPGSDNLIFSNKNSSIPFIPVGRLAATKDEEVLNYLAKVKEYESKLKNPQSNRDLYWRKRILHLVGGSIQDRFDFYLASMKEKIETNAFHAQVTTTTKTSSDPIQGGVSEIVKNLINQGVSIKVYLGHGAVSATEVGLDDPELFNNVGLYPLSFSLGCLTGNTHTTGYSLSEAFVLSKKGNIGYIASSGFGYPHTLSNYGNAFYDLLGTTHYTQTIAKIHFDALKLFDAKTDYPTKSLNEQLSFHGDPAVQLNYSNGPDFTMDFSTFKFNPVNVQADQDSLRCSVDVWNLGRYSNQPVDLTITHTLPDGQVLTYSKSVLLQKSYATVNLTLPMPEDAVGNNHLSIFLDPLNKYAETPSPFAENNNELRDDHNIKGISFSIFNNEAKPISPKPFAIVGDPAVSLKAFASNAFGDEANYYFEIDTTPLFNSLLLRNAILKQRGGMITWKPTLNLVANTVYYWRVAADTLATNHPFIWNQSSFVFLPGQGPGWNQSHAYQFSENPVIKYLHYSTDTRSWGIDPEPVSVVASSINHASDPNEYSKVLFNGVRLSRNNRSFNSEFMVTIWDTKTGNLDLNPIGGRDGALNVFNSVVGTYYFPMDKNTTQERANLINFLENGVKPGQYIIVNNHIEPGQSYFPESWAADSVALGKNLFQVFESMGASQIRNLANFPSYPYVFIFIKGGKVIDEKISSDGLQVRSSFEVTRPRTVGAIQSLVIGPASSWQKFEWIHQDLRNPRENTILILGQTDMGMDTLFKSSAASIDMSFVNAAQYRTIKLEWQARDTGKTGSLNLNHWRVFYTGLSDLAINANDAFEFYKDTIDQGEQVRIRFTIENAGEQKTDSSVIVFSITDPQNTTTRDTLVTAGLEPGQKRQVNREFSTDHRTNQQTLLVESKTQNNAPEFTLLNNTGRIHFFVVSDYIPPTINVLFDGKLILNNELVSRQPSIQIELKDNKTLSPVDTSQIQLSIKYPGTDRFILVPRKDYSYSISSNQAVISYLPQFTLSGTYGLRVQGKDKSGNQSGDAPYEINFKIITDNTVSVVLPYPNPFTTQCRFAYTLTGERPQVFKIQIMTVAGRIVRELTEMDLGPLQEGTHLTEHAWDGYDEYGNKLANGTYLYRVVMKDNNGKSYTSFEESEGSTEGDARRFFTKGIGKIVILR
ncbi:MAG: C25 family cysteine peptidase [Saprospiraceae bacterium]|nr:C25 family cysteine peptidase [Saprospiraceae bacterium]